MRRLVTLAFVCASLFGCTAGGVVPGGPHSMSSATLDGLLRSASSTYGVRQDLLAALVDAESHGDPSAVSRSGAQGLMQLMPGTARDYGVFNAFDPSANVDGGTRYLRDLLHRYHGDVKLALAAYNAGPGAVDAAHGIPPFAETRAYVARITAAIR